MSRLHFAGVAGSGMSALAQLEAMRGGGVSGSDRAFDRGERAELRAALEALGIAIHPQDGSGVAGAEEVVASTAVEDAVADLVRARSLGIPVVHRSELLARFVAEKRTIAIAGTSGKSSVVAMTFEILRAAGRDPSVLTGGEIVSLRRDGAIGNAWAGGGDLLVVEADESDGSLVRYEPAVAVVTNVSKDHQEVAETTALFATLAARARESVVVGEDPELGAIAPDAPRFGLGARAAIRAEAVEIGASGSTFTVDGVRFEVPGPGRHVVSNALASIAACRAVGVPLAAMAPALAAFCGVARRFETVGIANGVRVIDDYAHNPAKIAAAIAAAKLSGRVVAVFQPHGFGPTRFLLEDLARAFVQSLDASDRLFLLDVYFAGGTARRDVSSEDIALCVRALRGAADVSSRDSLPATIVALVRPGDVVLVMGARDATLTTLARAILERIRSGR